MAIKFNTKFVLQWLWTVLGSAVLAGLGAVVTIATLQAVPGLSGDLNSLSDYNWDLMVQSAWIAFRVNFVITFLMGVMKSPLTFDKVFIDTPESVTINNAENVTIKEDGRQDVTISK